MYLSVQRPNLEGARQLPTTQNVGLRDTFVFFLAFFPLPCRAWFLLYFLLRAYRTVGSTFPPVVRTYRVYTYRYVGSTVPLLHMNHYGVNQRREKSGK